jgi:hypothetical protein
MEYCIDSLLLLRRGGSGVVEGEGAGQLDVAPLGPAEIDVEVCLITAVLDGIGLQWLLDPSTDVVASVSSYITRTVAAWRRGIETARCDTPPRSNSADRRADQASGRYSS